MSKLKIRFINNNDTNDSLEQVLSTLIAMQMVEKVREHTYKCAQESTEDTEPLPEAVNS